MNCKKCGRPSKDHVSAVANGKGLNWSINKGCSGFYKKG